MANPYHNEAQQRILKTLMCLFGHEVNGLTPSEIAKAVETSNANTTRDVANLEIAGVAERVPHNNNVRLSPMLGQRAIAILTSIERHAANVEGVRQRFTRAN